MAIKAVFFDMGETLCYQNPPTTQIVGEFLARQGTDIPPALLRQGYLAAMTYFSEWSLKVDVDQRTREERELMVARFYRVMLLNMGLEEALPLIPVLRDELADRGERRFSALFEDVIPALDGLRELGLKLGIISNWDFELTNTVGELGLTSYMEVVVSSANVGIEKPNAAIFHYALERIGVSAAESCHVGDIYYMDVLGARGAGLTPVLIDRHRLQRGVDCLRIESLTQLLSLLDEVSA